MFDEVTEEILWGRNKLTLKTGKIARQSDGAVLATWGDTVVLCTVNAKKDVNEEIKFFPLIVNYREMSFAAGKIPGGFIKREGKPSDHEVLISRLIDRPIRPLFHKNFYNETQVICTVLSHDLACNPDILSIISASAALSISGLPFLKILAAVRVGLIDDTLILNPSSEELENSLLDLVMAGTSKSIIMVETEAKEVKEELVLKALEFGHNEMQPVIQLISNLKAKINRNNKNIINFNFKREEKLLLSIEQKIIEQFGNDIDESLNILNKKDRSLALDLIESKILSAFVSDKISNFVILDLFENIKAKKLRMRVIQNDERIDKRKLNEIRNITSEINVLPKTHGSALFTRGETQALVVVTLGTTSDEQIIDHLEGEKREKFLLHYIFPPYSVGEVAHLKSPARREIGHGRLAWKALKSILPTKDLFPYTIRIVSEITESNGSSSMATVCGTSLALMDAGIPIKSAVAGIAMGLIKEKGKSTILTDILGDEDALGDMDFKVAGTKNGITALQMDIKIDGIDLNIISQAFKQAKVGRLQILELMSNTIEVPRENISKYAPIIKLLKIDKDKIKDLIGPGGKIIKNIISVSSTKIEVSDNGLVQVIGFNDNNIQTAVQLINETVGDLPLGEIVEATIVKIIDSGLWAKFYGGREGFIHISEISSGGKIDSIHNYVSIGQEVRAKIIGLDNKGKVKLSIRSVQGLNPKVKKMQDVKTFTEKKFFS